MFLAQQKKKENIAEYILYMWQIEDIIRAYQFDIDAIQTEIIRPSSLSEEEQRQLLEWYLSLIEMMRFENIQQAGHLQFVSNTMADLVDLHYALVQSKKHPDYHAQLYKSLPYIADFMQSADTTLQKNDEIEGCFVFLYGVLLLRLQKKSVSQETSIALEQISKLLALLSYKYRLYQQNELELESLEE
jgi:hypothetical protein